MTHRFDLSDAIVVGFSLVTAACSLTNGATASQHAALERAQRIREDCAMRYYEIVETADSREEALEHLDAEHARCVAEIEDACRDAGGCQR